MQKVSGIDVHTSAIASALLEAGASHDGQISPRRVVEVARDPQSVLHDQFEWDDEKAGEAYRLAQAGALIRRVRIAVVRLAQNTREIEIRTMRAYQSRPSQRHAEGGYEMVASLIADPAKRDELIDQVLRELAAYRRRYADLLALTAVWAAIDSAIDDLAPTRQGEAGQASLGREGEPR